MRFFVLNLLTLLLVFTVALGAAAQTSSPVLRASAPAPTAARSETSITQAERRKFVLDVVQAAVGLPQPDPQDRLRVLHSAANVVGPLDNKMAQQFAKEGIRIEMELVSQRQRPDVSMFSGGHVDCAAALTFVQTIPPAAVLDAEQSLLGAISSCSQQVNMAARQKLEAGLEKGELAPRPLLALMEADGMNTSWSRAMFARIFDSLPSDVPANIVEAPNYGAMFVRGASEMDQDTVKTAGLKFLGWLGKVPDSPQRQVAVNMTTDTLNKILGNEAYDKLLSSDIVAYQVASSGNRNAVLPPPSEEGVSVLQAMGNKNDRTGELLAMHPSLRAREAAASGFASGTSGDRKSADHYFDIAFSSLDRVWIDRATLTTSAPAVVEEVSEAAAQVDPIAALQRSQRLSDSSSQAISMLAVARVVVGSE